MSESPEMRVSDLGVTRLFGVKGKTVLVTGGARGIGLMIAAGFVANGATVYIASRSADACETAARRLTAAGPGTCHALAADLGTETGCAALAAALKSRERALHVLVNNSGTSWGAPMATHDTKGWDKTYDLNVKGVFFLTRELLPLLDAASTPTDPARVINIGSVAGIRPQVFPTFSYDVSKAAVHHLTRKLADELADRRSEGGHAITVNAIAPGYVPSRMSAQLGEYEESEKIAKSGIPLRRRGNAADMAGSALFLAGEAGAWISGVVLRVDGGMLSKL
jgi:NAD(P)-dependent dehydrogenase (short-subunit alcohol dehydrogenase family)